MFYLLCATPRVGSNLLQSLLFNTEVAGDAKEFFCVGEVLSLGRAHCGFADLTEASASLDVYLEAMRAHHSRGGCFGIKAHFHQFRWALDHGLDLTRWFPDRFLFLTRDDLVGQAISHVRAQQTSAWTGRSEERREPSFDAERLRAAAGEIVAHNQAWEAFFQAIDVEPLRLSYERLCADFGGELERVLRFLDVDPSTVDLERAVARATGWFRVQRDATNEEWRARYDEFLRARAADQSRRMACAEPLPA